MNCSAIFQGLVESNITWGLKAVKLCKIHTGLKSFLVFLLIIQGKIRQKPLITGLITNTFAVS